MTVDSDFALVWTIVNITHGVWKAGSHDKVCYSGVSRDKYGASDRIRLQCLHLESALEIYKNPLLSEISEMPGANCSIFGCGTSRKHAGVGIFRITQGQDEKSKETRQAWIDIITKDRVVDTDLRRQIDNNSLYVCENHFKKEEVELGRYILGVFIDFYYFCDINEWN